MMAAAWETIEMPKTIKGILVCLFASAVPGLVGCQSGALPNSVAVSGRVTLDGQPLERGMVRFAPDGQGHPALGAIDAGRFTMKATASSPGVVRGTYRVSIVCREAEVMDAEGKFPQPKSLIPERYEDCDTSGLAIEVTAPIRDLVFELSSK